MERIKMYAHKRRKERTMTNKEYLGDIIPQGASWAELVTMSKDTANKLLSAKDKIKWCELHSATANLYVIRNGEIVDVPPSGWWY